MRNNKKGVLNQTIEEPKKEVVEAKKDNPVEVEKLLAPEPVIEPVMPVQEEIKADETESKDEEELDINEVIIEEEEIIEEVETPVVKSLTYKQQRQFQRTGQIPK